MFGLINSDVQKSQPGDKGQKKNFETVINKFIEQSN